MILASHRAPPSAQQVKAQHHDRYDEQDVYQAPGYMEAEAEQPQDQQNYEDRPKHIASIGTETVGLIA